MHKKFGVIGDLGVTAIQMTVAGLVPINEPENACMESNQTMVRVRGIMRKILCVGEHHAMVSWLGHRRWCCEKRDWCYG